MHAPNQISLAAKASGEPEFREIGLGPWSETHPGEPRPDDPTSPNYDGRFDSVLLNDGDRRNVLDRYRYWTVAAIKADLDARGRHDFEVAVENWTHDFNIGSMVRTANAFQAKRVHIVGPHKWNRKGALMTELYQHVEHHPSIAELVESWHHRIAGEIAYERAKAGVAAIHAHDVAVDGDNKHLHELLAEIDACDARIKELQAARVIAPRYHSRRSADGNLYLPQAVPAALRCGRPRIEREGPRIGRRCGLHLSIRFRALH